MEDEWKTCSARCLTLSSLIHPIPNHLQELLAGWFVYLSKIPSWLTLNIPYPPPARHLFSRHSVRPFFSFVAFDRRQIHRKYASIASDALSLPDRFSSIFACFDLSRLKKKNTANFQNNELFSSISFCSSFFSSSSSPSSGAFSYRRGWRLVRNS